MKARIKPRAFLADLGWALVFVVAFNFTAYWVFFGVGP